MATVRISVEYGLPHLGPQSEVTVRREDPAEALAEAIAAVITGTGVTMPSLLRAVRAARAARQDEAGDIKAPCLLAPVAGLQLERTGRVAPLLGVDLSGIAARLNRAFGPRGGRSGPT